jgi:hypothetical protein
LALYSTGFLYLKNDRPSHSGGAGNYADQSQPHVFRFDSHGLVAVLLIVLATAQLAPSAFAQPQADRIATGALVGFVTGPKQEKLAGVKASLSTQDLQPPSVQTITDEGGQFKFGDVRPGMHTLDISLAGWTSKRLYHVKIRAGDTVHVNIALSRAQPPSAASTSTLPIGFPSLTESYSPTDGSLDGTSWSGQSFGHAAMQDLPSAGTVWSVLDGQATGAVIDKYQGGGLETGTAALFGAHGASWTENTYLLNGFDVTDPYTTGQPMINPDYDGISEMDVVTASKPAMLAGSGVSLAINTPQPDASFHATVRGFYSGNALQSENMNARLKSLGFPGPEMVNQLGDESGQLGGKLPLPGASWPFFVSFSSQQLSSDLGGFVAPIDSHADHALVELAPYVRGGQRLDVLLSAQQNFDSRDGADPTVQPSATLRRTDDFQQMQARWRDVLSPESVLQAGFALTHAGLSSGLQSGALGVSTLDLPTMTWSGAAPLATSGGRVRYAANTSMARVYDGIAGKHVFTFGGDFDRSDIANSWNALDGIEQVLVDGTGAEAIKWNTPTEAREHVQNLAAFVQDAWQPFKWLSVPLGLRLDNSSGSAVGASGKINWTTPEPRVAVVFPVSHGVVIRGGWTRYGHALEGRYLDYGNPAALGGQVFRWQDTNGDGQVEPGELTQLLQVFGGPYSSISPNLKRPLTDELTLSGERQFGKHFAVWVGGFFRNTHGLIDPLDAGVPFSDYTPATITDPGLDGIIGGPTEQPLVVYNENPAALGKDFWVLSNTPYDALAKGLDVELRWRFGQRFQADLNFTGMLTRATTSVGYTSLENDTGVIGTDVTNPAIGSPGANPNALLFAPGLTYFDRGKFGKLNVYYQAPRKVRVGVLARYNDGLPFGRELFVDTLNQGPIFVRAMPYSDCCGVRTLYNFTLDVRLEREFAVRMGTVSAMVDCFNLLNGNNNTFENPLTSPTFLERVPLSIQAPRLARLGFEWSF